MTAQAPGFQVWRRRGRFVSALLRLRARPLVAQELPPHGRAQTPAFSDLDVLRVLDWVYMWAEIEAEWQFRYLKNSLNEPQRAMAYARVLRERSDEAARKFRTRVHVALYGAAGDRNAELAEEALQPLWELAENFKNWVVRRNSRSLGLGDISVAYQRAQWHLLEFLYTLEAVSVE